MGANQKKNASFRDAPPLSKNPISEKTNICYKQCKGGGTERGPKRKRESKSERKKSREPCVYKEVQYPQSAERTGLAHLCGSILSTQMLYTLV